MRSSVVAEQIGSPSRHGASERPLVSVYEEGKPVTGSVAPGGPASTAEAEDIAAVDATATASTPTATRLRRGRGSLLARSEDRLAGCHVRMEFIDLVMSAFPDSGWMDRRLEPNAVNLVTDA